MSHRPTAPERIRLADRSGSGIRTIDRAYAGATIRDTTRERIARAARELGLPPPPAPAANHDSTTPTAA